MAIVLTVLEILLWLVLALLIALVLILCLPAVMSVRYSDGKPAIWLRLLWFVKIPISLEKKSPKKGKTGKQSDIQPAKKQGKGKYDLAFFKQLLTPGKKALAKIFSAISIRNIRLFWPVHSSSPARTAIDYGETQAFFGTLLGLLGGTFKLSIDKIRIEPDYEGQLQDREYFSCEIFAVLIVMVIAAAGLVLNFIKIKNASTTVPSQQKRVQLGDNTPEQVKERI